MDPLLLSFVALAALVGAGLFIATMALATTRPQTEAVMARLRAYEGGTDLSLEELWHGHSRSGAVATLAVVPNEHPDRYGGAVLDADGAIERFVQSDFYKTFPELDYKRRLVARLKNVNQPPPELSVLIGDTVHNLRSALDLLAYAMADALVEL